MKSYLFEYRHKGETWGLEIVASSPEDAEERLKAIPWARYQGETVAKVRVPFGSFFARLFGKDDL
jgi:hypothetical protein